MIREEDQRDLYVADFARLDRTLALRLAASLHPIRTGAIARFAQTGFPTMRLEDWRHTDLRTVASTRFFRPEGMPALDPGVFAPFAGPRLVFVNGQSRAEGSHGNGLARGLDLADLAQAFRIWPALVERHLARHLSYRENPFVALNTAFLADGAFVRVRRGQAAPGPIHVVHVTVPGAEPVLSQPRTLILLEEGSQATVVESYLEADGTSPVLTNAATEVVLEAGSVLEHCRILWESVRGHHVGSLQVIQDRDSRYTAHSVSFGGALVRVDHSVALARPGASCALNGLYLAADRQHLDHHTFIDHQQAHATSLELYKGVLTGSASAVFNGRIRVGKDAAKTDARQANDNLLLSDAAVVHTQPQLEINADDVKCSHGATIGQIDPDAVFYLRSRGIDGPTARTLLVNAFMGEVVDRIPDEGVRSGVRRGLQTLLPGVA